MNVRKITANIGKGVQAVAEQAKAGAKSVKMASANIELSKPKGDSYDEALNQTMGKFGKLLSNLKDGEYMNILVTAFGTAVVAPIFIAFNPLSKKDKETKMYSALRQPISAVIAVAAQMSVVKALNDALDKYASTGGVEGMDLRAKQKDSYLKKIIKMEKPNISKEDLLKEIKARQDATFRQAIEEETKNLQNVATEDILTKENAICVKDYTNKIKELKSANNGKVPKDAKIEDEILASIKETVKKNAEKLLEEKPDKYANIEEATRAATIEKFVNAKIAKAGDMLSSNKKYLGIVLSLLTLPVTCGILNWAYPRIVEKFFPSLANSKKESEAKKAEAQVQPSAQKIEKEGK